MEITMPFDELVAFCESYAGVTSDYPFGPDTQCFRVGGKIFAMFCPLGAKGAEALLGAEENETGKPSPMIILRCLPEESDFYRRQYAGAIFRPYHIPKPQQAYSNTVFLDRGLSETILKELVQKAYYAVFVKLPKKAQKELLESKR